ncbi:unnamed protein product [Lactuca virosa]|uniref:SET domain-containing protein n=1 Tax=Lactuca virosa TaxID=75947 RepID=A0AAU9PA01_9ASTR|nr:unnamed protein product [Lactuca virosa]
MPLKVKRLARDPERFVWAVSMAQTRHINFRIRFGSLIQDANMFAPYADMLNHSCKPNCFFHWRFRDRMFEVMTNVGQRIKKGEDVNSDEWFLKRMQEMSLNYHFTMEQEVGSVMYFWIKRNRWKIVAISEA